MIPSPAVVTSHFIFEQYILFIFCHVTNRYHLSSLSPLPSNFEGNMGLTIYFTAPVEMGLIKVTVGPKDTEVVRVVSNKDVYEVASAKSSSANVVSNMMNKKGENFTAQKHRDAIDMAPGQLQNLRIL